MDALKSRGQMLDQINLEQIPRSGFDLSYSTKGSGKIGRIIPTRCMECLPSDSIKGSTQAALQFQPLAVPILANMRVKQETWYVPNHILLDNWDTFITKGQDLSDNSILPSFSLQVFLRDVLPLYCVLFGENSVTTGGPTLYIQPYATNDFSAENGVQYANMFYDVVEFLDYWQNVLDKTYMGQSYSVPFGMDDLFDYRIEVLKNYLTAFRSRYDIAFTALPECYVTDNGGVRHFRGIPVFASNSSNYLGSSYYFSSYKEYPQVFDQLDTQLVGVFSQSQGLYKVFSDEMKMFLQLLEDLLSPVVGVGSMFDYLGYNVLTPVDFRYLYLHSFCEYYAVKAQPIGAGNLPLFASLNMNDYIPVDLVSSSSQSVLPLRACYAIWYNNYRDKLLELDSPEPVTKSVVSSDELFVLSVLRIRAWSKDSFNTALANTGTGNMVVPISQQLSGVRKEYDFAAKSTENMLDLGLTQYTLADGSTIDMPTRYLSSNHLVNKVTGLKYEFSLDTLRRAGRTEKWIQKALIYGNLIQDALFTHWGVKIKNERIQLPEFVTSSSQLVKIDTILNNTTTAESVAGDKAGFASAYDEGTNFDWYSPENGYLLSFMTVLPEQTYAYGKPRHLSKLRIFDFAFPEFAQIGMDAVYNEEIKLTGIDELNEEYAKGIFGYQGRYYDYKCKQDEEHGQLRTTDDMYTFSRDFNIYDPNSRPKLNYRFVHCHPSLDMFVMDDPSQDQFRYDIHHSVAASRALPVCGMSV